MILKDKKNKNIKQKQFKRKLLWMVMKKTLDGLADFLVQKIQAKK